MYPCEKMVVCLFFGCLFFNNEIHFLLPWKCLFTQKNVIDVYDSHLHSITKAKTGEFSQPSPSEEDVRGDGLFHSDSPNAQKSWF